MPQRKQNLTVNSQDIGKRREMLSQEAREAQLSALAMDLAEARLRAGTASSQEVVYFLKIKSYQSMLECEKIEAETELAKAKVQAVKSQEHSEELYENALKAMRSYSGQSEDN